MRQKRHGGAALRVPPWRRIHKFRAFQVNKYTLAFYTIVISSGNGSQPITANNWSQIKFTSKLIPEFAGKEDQNVVTWLERCASIARMYQVPEETLILAAINQLSKRALDWYNPSKQLPRGKISNSRYVPILSAKNQLQ